jgi:hypothetical protein
MYTRELLLAVGLLLLLTFGRREHLAFTETIKDVRNTVSPEEQNRIFALAPASLQQKAIALNTAQQNPIDRSKTHVSAIISDFQGTVYVPATDPITETVVDNYVARVRGFFQEIPLDPGNLMTPFYLEAFSNGDAKQLVMAYLGIAPAAARLPIASLPTSSTTAASIPNLLEQMRANLLEYKMTGRSEYKSVYDGTKSWLDQYISSQTMQLNREADQITSDVTTYQTANADMTQTQTDFQRVKTEGPKLEDSYLTIKKQMDQVPGADSTGLYIKGGIAVGLILGAVGLTLF